MADKAIKMNKGSDVLSFYPVGSIYMSVNSTSPETLFGGTWEQIQNRFLLAAGSSYTAGNTGGASTVTLSTSQMPSHTHTFTGTSATTSNKSLTGSVILAQNIAMNTDSSQIVDWASGVFTTHSDTLNQVYLTNPSGGTVVHINKYYHQNGFNINASHDHTVTAKGSNSSTGGSEAHDNMPPYLVVYMWVRTA